MSARMAAMEQTQAEFRQQLSEMLLTSQNNEQALKANTLTLDNLATKLTNIMNKLESRTILSEPNPTVNNGDVQGGVPKSTCENQAQSRPTRIGTSITLPIDVVDDTDDRSQDNNAPIVYKRLTRSKDAKLKGVTVSQENSQVGSKGRASEEAPKKMRLAKGGAKRRATAAAATGQPITPDDGRQEVETVVGGVVEHGSGPPNIAVGGSGVEVSGDGGGKGGNMKNATKGVTEKVGGNGEHVSGEGGSLGGGKGLEQSVETEHVEGRDVVVLAEVASLVPSAGKGDSPESASNNTNIMSPSKIGDIGASNSAHGGQVSLPLSFCINSIAEPYNQTKFVIFNVHGTLLDTSLLIQPNPNSNIPVTKKTYRRRFLFRPWLIEFLGRCFKMFKIAFWDTKSSEYMEEVLREILPALSHLEGHTPIFMWSGKDCELIQKSDEISLWGKPLTKVWKKWPCWDATNTVIIDHHEPRVDFNPQSNVIVPPSFYVANMKDLFEDKDYLKQKLWPALEGLYVHQDVGSFWSTLEAGVCELNQFSKIMAKTTVDALVGEGSCQHVVFTMNIFSPSI